MDELIELNVGGVRHTTSRSTLLSHASSDCSFFTLLLEGRIPTRRDAQGAIFIDRDGHRFSPLLNYLRTGRISVPPTLSLTDIEEEAAFYQIELPAKLEEPKQKMKKYLFVRVREWCGKLQLYVLGHRADINFDPLRHELASVASGDDVLSTGVCVVVAKINSLVAEGWVVDGVKLTPDYTWLLTRSLEDSK